MVPFLSAAYERVVDQFVGHAVDEKIGAFFHRCARRLQFSGVDRHAQLEAWLSSMAA